MVHHDETNATERRSNKTIYAIISNNGRAPISGSLKRALLRGNAHARSFGCGPELRLIKREILSRISLDQTISSLMIFRSRTMPVRMFVASYTRAEVALMPERSTFRSGVPLNAEASAFAALNSRNRHRAISAEYLSHWQPAKQSNRGSS